MFETTKVFIEKHIELIEQLDWRDLFDLFYADELRNRYCEEIVLTLKKALPDQAEAIKAAQEYVFIENFDSKLTTDDYGKQLETILHRLPNSCGFQVRKLPKILAENGYALEKRNNMLYLVN